ncbi:MAG: hypothetical protein HGA44_07370 [Cellulomonadaceae bacterium]|nr:hypothetical protein [Cellulomonadaceae bacterium]
MAEDHGRVVLVALLSKLPAVALAGGWLQSHTGLSAAEVGDALRVLETDGVIGSGSIASGRADFLTPTVLDVLGVGDLALPWETTADVPPSGCAVEVTDAELTEAFASAEVAA